MTLAKCWKWEKETGAREMSKNPQKDQERSWKKKKEQNHGECLNIRTHHLFIPSFMSPIWLGWSQENSGNKMVKHSCFHFKVEAGISSSSLPSIFSLLRWPTLSAMITWRDEKRKDSQRNAGDAAGLVLAWLCWKSVTVKPSLPKTEFMINHSI